MTSSSRDPFGERRRLPHRKKFLVLGLRISVHSNSGALLRLFEEAFGGLSAQRVGQRAPDAEITLLRIPAGSGELRTPRPPRLCSGAGFLAALVDCENFAIVSVPQRRALVQVDGRMLGFRDLLRYELIEFCVYTLAARLLRLAPLHGAAVAHGGRAVFLSGPAGSGKSTAAVNCAGAGLELVSEDAVFVEPRSLRVAGCANFLHVRTDSLAAVRDARLRNSVKRAPVIRRRSGVHKFELDIRRAGVRTASRAPTLAAIVVLSRARARGKSLLEPLSRAALIAHLRVSQPYARAQDSWQALMRSAALLPAYRLLRGQTPEDSAAALRELLEARP